MEVAPPMWTENRGSAYRRSNASSFAWRNRDPISFLSKGACWPKAEKVIWLPRSSSDFSPVLFGLEARLCNRRLERGGEQIISFSIYELFKNSSLNCLLGSGRFGILFLISSKDSKGFSSLSLRISCICFFPNPGKNSS